MNSRSFALRLFFLVPLLNFLFSFSLYAQNIDPTVTSFGKLTVFGDDEKNPIPAILDPNDIARLSLFLESLPKEEQSQLRRQYLKEGLPLHELVIKALNSKSEPANRSRPRSEISSPAFSIDGAGWAYALPRDATPPSEKLGYLAGDWGSHIMKNEIERLAAKNLADSIPVEEQNFQLVQFGYALHKVQTEDQQIDGLRMSRENFRKLFPEEGDKLFEKAKARWQQIRQQARSRP